VRAQLVFGSFGLISHWICRRRIVWHFATSWFLRWYRKGKSSFDSVKKVSYPLFWNVIKKWHSNLFDKNKMPILSQHVCFVCRKVFKKPHFYASLHREAKRTEAPIYTCPDCGRNMVYMGYKFRAPPRAAIKEWKNIEVGVKLGTDWTVQTIRKEKPKPKLSPALKKALGIRIKWKPLSRTIKVLVDWARENRTRTMVETKRCRERARLSRIVLRAARSAPATLVSDLIRWAIKHDHTDNQIHESNMLRHNSTDSFFFIRKRRTHRRISRGGR